MKKIAAFFTLSSIAIVANGADWPEWGGTPHNNMASVSMSIPSHMDPGKRKKGTEEIDLSTTKNVKWVAKIGSQSYGTPTVAEGKVLETSAAVEGIEEFEVAVETYKTEAVPVAVDVEVQLIAAVVEGGAWLCYLPWSLWWLVYLSSHY